MACAKAPSGSGLGSGTQPLASGPLRGPRASAPRRAARHARSVPQSLTRCRGVGVAGRLERSFLCNTRCGGPERTSAGAACFLAARRGVTRAATFWLMRLLLRTHFTLPCHPFSRVTHPFRRCSSAHVVAACCLLLWLLPGLLLYPRPPYPAATRPKEASHSWRGLGAWRAASSVGCARIHRRKSCARLMIGFLLIHRRLLPSK